MSNPANDISGIRMIVLINKFDQLLLGVSRFYVRIFRTSPIDFLG